jgi:hypothetical protein
MSQRELILLTPYRMPAQNTLSLAEEETAAFLNGYSALWHPAVLAGASGPPKIASPYDYEQPSAGHIYAIPDSPPLLLPDDWDQRVIDAGAVAFRTTGDRDWTFSNLRAALEHAKFAEDQADLAKRSKELLDVPADRLAAFLGIGFGYLILDTLFEAMQHENLLATAELWQQLQEAVNKLTDPDPEAFRQHLKTAADTLLAGREVLYPVTIHIIDLYLLDEARIAEPFPAAFERGQAVNILASAAVLEKLSREQPERLAVLHDRAQSGDTIEIITGGYQEREDALLPIESQLWNLLKAQNIHDRLFDADLRVFGRKRFAAHPQLPMLLNGIGVNRALLLPFDAAVLPNFRSAVTNWPSPDGKQVEAFTRSTYAADSAGTFFHLAHYLERTIRQDTAANLALLHTGKPASPWYQDWVELNRFGPILGQWTPLYRFLGDAMSGEYVSAPTADDFHSDYLEERTNAHVEQPVSWFARHLRLRRQLDTVWSLAAIFRGLAGRNDPLRLEGKLAELEDKLEEGGDPASELAEVQQQVGETLAQRLVARATTDRPGYMVLNPCSFTRRVALEIDGAGAVPVEGPVKASQLDGNLARLVVEVPGLGFAWFPKGQPGAAPPKGRTLADKNGVRNEFFEADIDPASGGLKAIRDLRNRINRLSQQLVFNPGSTMKLTETQVTSTGPALGEIVTSGVLLDEQNQELAKFRQRLRAWLGRPVLEMRFEIEPVNPPTGYPWHNYYGARFAWGSERATLLRGVNGISYITTHTRPESPEFLEIRLGQQQRTTLFVGGLPFAQRHSNRMLDLILLPEGETARAFDISIGLDREHPTQTALGMATPVPLVATAKGPPHVGAAGWLFHLDASNLLLLGMRPATDGGDAIQLRLQECSVHGGAAEFRCVRNPSRAMLQDLRGKDLTEVSVSNDAVLFDVAACDLVHLRVEFS